MKPLSKYMWEMKWLYLVAFLSLFLAELLDLLSPQLTNRIVDDVILGGKIDELTWIILAFLGIGIGRCIFGYVRDYIFDMTGSKISSNMRRDIFKHIQTLSASYFDKTNTGELMSRVKDDIDHIWDALGFVGMLLVQVVFHTGLVIFFMMKLNPVLTIIPIVAMIICGGIAVIMERKLGSVYEAISEENAKLNTVAEENLGGVRTVKSFAREEFEIKKFLSHNKKYYDLNMTQSKVFVKYYPYFSVITKILPLMVLLFGAHYVINKDMTLGQLTAFVDYSQNIVWPMEMLGWLTNSFSSAVASNKKIRKISNTKPDVTEKENPVILPEVKGGITFDKVCFHKEDMHEILHDISFDIKPGQTLGIMGATGAGKSSIIQLLQRMYDATEGSISLDGVDIRDLTLSQLRSNINCVSQDVFLFSDTILENIKMGAKINTDYDRVRRAAKDAQAADFIERMDEKYDTVIGERGVGLSGGQKQRISIARALAKKSPILVLDDSTSALDMETEHEIQNMLNSLDGTTKIIIGHRISAVRSADEIIVLEDGKVAERGTHEELLDKKGIYYVTYTSQYSQEPDTSVINGDAALVDESVKNVTGASESSELPAEGGDSNVI